MALENAPAKINLHLHVTGRQPDGYHVLDSLVVFAEAGDVLRADPAAMLSLALDGPFGASLKAEPDNLVLRAARALAGRHGIAPGAALRLTKSLPVASGIGGGSADAAAALRLLARLWGVGLAGQGALDRATGLGADVPVGLAARPTRMGGIGQHLAPAPTLPACGLVLVNPGVALATAAVFRARQGDFSPPAALPAGWADAAAMAADLALLSNDLQAPAIALCPPVAAVLAALAAQPGTLLARMSGSGATCFALCATPEAARQMAAAVVRAEPGWWCWGGGLYGGQV